MGYEYLPDTSVDVAAALLETGTEDQASRAILAAALHSSDQDALLALLLRAAKSRSALTRGNAILGLGHLARRFSSLDRILVAPTLREALSDPDQYVRGHATSAVEDARTFAGWAESDVRADA